jgi:hypothetical protein
MENWCWTWLFGGGQSYGSVDAMIRAGGNSSGETTFVASTPYAIPYTYYPPQYGCTDPTANNYAGAAVSLYQRLFTSPVILSGGACSYPPPPPPPPPILRPHVNINGSWYRSKDVYIKDAGSWKLCTSAYVKDGGVWKPFLT